MRSSSRLGTSFERASMRCAMVRRVMRPELGAAAGSLRGMEQLDQQPREVGIARPAPAHIGLS